MASLPLKVSKVFASGRRCLTSLRVAGVPEHFFAPFHIAERRGLYKAQGLDFQWVATPQGTGKMADMLAAGEVDMALMVSEGAVAQVAGGAPFKIVGTYVQSPLRLGVHVKGGGSVSSVQDLKGKKFGVSRMGSNSHLMSFVLGHQQGWKPKTDVKLEIVQTLGGAQQAMATGGIDAFVWERFTAKHLVDTGEWDLVTELPSPWHPFLFVASERSLAQLSSEIKSLVDITAPVCREFKENSGGSTFKYLAEHHGLDKVDATDWLDSTEWACRLDVADSTLNKTQDALNAIGVLQAHAALDTMLATGVCTHAA